MEKHRCKLCYRRFANGRALGGHMRSHMMNLPLPPKPEPRRSFDIESSPPPSSSSSSSSSESEQEEGEIVKDKLLCKLREHPKKCVKLTDVIIVDDVAPTGSSSVTLQDRESETESSKNPTRRRSKRTRKPASSIQYHRDYNQLHSNFHRSICETNYYNDGEPGSSVSDVTSEEDVAYCLMMLSRDKWNNGDGYGYGYDFSNNKEEFTNNVIDKPPISHQRKKYQCDTCNKVFRSYQALGGHRASHKKLRISALQAVHNNVDDNDNDKNFGVVLEDDKKIHECPVCYRVFGSGQALGGHKRSHVIAGGGSNNENSVPSSVAAPSLKKKSMVSESLIDLNLPAPVDDEEETSQIALSAVSDVHL